MTSGFTVHAGTINGGKSGPLRGNRVYSDTVSSDTVSPNEINPSVDIY